MNLKHVFIAMAVAVLGASSMGCSSACDDLEACCEDAGGTNCTVGDADEDACEAALDLYEAAGVC